MPGLARHPEVQQRIKKTSELYGPAVSDADDRTWVCEKRADGEEFQWTSLRALCCCLCCSGREADVAGQAVATNHDAAREGGKLEPASDMFLVYLRVFAEKCGLLDFLKLFVFSLASRKPAAATHDDDAPAEVIMPGRSSLRSLAFAYAVRPRLRQQTELAWLVVSLVVLFLGSSVSYRPGKAMSTDID